LIYLLDTNVLIDANRDYYPIRRVSEFWEWLEYMGKKGSVKIPIEIYEEIKEGSDDLSIWAKKPSVESALLLIEEADVALVSYVIERGYANDLTEVEVERLGRDPFLIAYALQDINNRCVVTTEVSKPKSQRANRHIPDVCGTLNIPCCNTFRLISDLDFSTKWTTIIDTANIIGI